MRSAPTCVSLKLNHINFFYRGGDDSLWLGILDESKQFLVESLKGILTSQPAAFSLYPNTIDIFSRGIDNALWHKDWNGTNWLDW